MSDIQLQRRDRGTIKERGQYLLAFGVVVSMLLVANVPLFVIFFFGIFAYFLLRMFSSGSRSETREIFEFYLTANEMLRDDERRWYGFELNEAIRRGEDIVRRMKSAPPLVHFTLGALQNKVGNYKAAITSLTYVVENSSSDEKSLVSPSSELQSYVRVLRKIEREPTEAPLTSAAVRALERARRLRSKALLEESRQKFAAIPVIDEAKMALESAEGSDHFSQSQPALRNISYSVVDDGPVDADRGRNRRGSPASENEHGKADPYVDRQSISELLHDIYD
ncbi:MAG: hypothetical protein ABJB34_12455, partial [Acidobacteriota bacterium]